MKTARIIVTGVLMAAFLACSAAEGAQATWPEHHGAGRSNKSSETGLLKKWPEGGPARIWSYSECGTGFSGVSIADGLIFTAGDVGREEMVIALDMDGNLVWKQANGDSWRRSSPGSRATPTYNEGAVYHMNPTGRLASYEAKSGREIWAVDLKARFNAKYGVWALAENVIVDGDKVVCMPGGPEGRVVALNKKTGETIWANTEIGQSAAYCSGKIVSHGGARQLISMTQRSVVGVDVGNGKLLWSAPFLPRSPQNSLTPVYLDGHVFVSCGHSSGGRLIKPNNVSGAAETVWHREDLDDCHSGALLVDNRLYGTACRLGGRQFYCVDFFTGKDIKIDKTMGKVGITFADGMIYALNFQGTMYLLDVNANGFEHVSKFELERKPANSYLAHPVVCGGRLYVRCHDDLHAFDIRAN